MNNIIIVRYYSLPDESVFPIPVPRLTVSLSYIPIRPTIQIVPGSIPVKVYGDEIDELEGI